MWILWMFVFLQLLSVSYRIENNHIVSLHIDTYRIVWWPYRLIPNQAELLNASMNFEELVLAHTSLSSSANGKFLWLAVVCCWSFTYMCNCTWYTKAVYQLVAYVGHQVKKVILRWQFKKSLVWIHNEQAFIFNKWSW